jgi:voltage-gated potassium channel
LGQIFGIFITFLGVGMVAIPTGIISAGFVDQYSSMKKRVEYGYEADMHFIKIRIRENDKWNGMRITDLDLPEGVIIAIIKRKEEILIPRGDIVLQENDSLVVGAEPFDEHEYIRLKEIVLKEENPWNGVRIRDLDISRHTVIVLVKRKNKALIPNGNMVLQEGDRLFLYTKRHIKDVNVIDI